MPPERRTATAVKKLQILHHACMTMKVFVRRTTSVYDPQSHSKAFEIFRPGVLILKARTVEVSSSMGFTLAP